MARGTQLQTLTQRLRYEIRHAASASQGVSAQDGFYNLINRAYAEIDKGYDWPHRRVDRDVALSAGSRYYTIPTTIDPDRIHSVKTQYNGIWQPVIFGLDEAQYNILDPEDDEREDPVARWRYYENGQFEVWPLPDSNDLEVRFSAQLKLDRLQDASDEADHDDDLIVLKAAAEELKYLESADWEDKAREFNTLYARLRGGNQPVGMFQLGGSMTPPARPRPLYGKRS